MAVRFYFLPMTAPLLLYPKTPLWLLQFVSSLIAVFRFGWLATVAAFILWFAYTY
jgi:hypothetical protein